MKKILPVLLFIALPVFLFAANGDTIHVITHSRVLIQTDPSVGETKYLRWGVFPPVDKHYRKVILTLSYTCPDGLRCGEWDYNNHIRIRRKGGVGGDSVNTEIARFITPYGWNLGSTWKFSWDLDVTDYALLFHDSLEIEYQHSGYEAREDRGWLVTLDFTLTEGIPAMEPVKIEEAWTGANSYGSSTDPINNHLQPKSITVADGAELVRLRILQTGHGNEPTQGCSEFCDKYRDVFLDNTLVKREQLWKVCGDNPLYPQAGTWVYSRANWCPGAVVKPHLYDFSISSGSVHTVDLEMEQFIAGNQSSLGTYSYSSQFIHYKAPTLSNDAGIEDIVSPSMADVHARLNADCANPVIQVKNNGKNTITSLTFEYGFLKSARQTHTWGGTIRPQEIQKITLPGYVVPRLNDTTFKVMITKTNGQDDGYNPDNTMMSYSGIPQTFPNRFFLMYRPNKSMNENAYTITDANGKVLYRKSWQGLLSTIVYRDTFDLPVGCYNFTLTDENNDGIDFWANKQNVGSGFIRLMKEDGSVLKTLSGDFGSFTTTRFMVGTNVGIGEQEGSATSYMRVYPNPSAGNITIDVGLGQVSDAQVMITDMLGRNVYTHQYQSLGSDVLAVDLTHLKNGAYLVNLVTSTQTYSSKLILVR